MLDSKPTGGFNMQTSRAIAGTSAWEVGATAKWQAILAIGFGLVVVYVIGFSPISRIHNAAHDTRHSDGFPCH